ncbi:probable peptidoglycan muropeptide transporter SLC46 [Macrobrachium rosenbergii]|uniref:probable peptidoglycan muropeptide transporter SLC46 n=1 Tax=Macrobrachium rosenbergii TaxID=79674 RepID=UPI0034D45631
MRILKKIISSVTVEPVMLLDSLAFSAMQVYIESLQMDRVCQVNAKYSEEICLNLKAHQNASVAVQQKYSVFALYNGIIGAVLPLFFILFMGAWSDKYGRKVPLAAVQIGHLLHAGGYLLASFAPSWPVEIFLLLTFIDTLGGGNVCFLNAANSYIGDVSSEKERTSRVGLANSIWFIGGPAGTLMATFIYSAGGYLPLFATSLTCSLMAVLYIIVFLPESHGPFAKKSKTETGCQNAVSVMNDSVAAVYGIETRALKDTGCTNEVDFAVMIKDFFSLQRILDSFRSTFRKREGNTRGLILILISTCLLKRFTRSPYVFAFTRHVLGWEASDYSLWVTYKNLMTSTGSMMAVPLLSGWLRISDNSLAMIGAMSGTVEYVIYGCITEDRVFLIWIAPVSALLLNSCTIAQRSMMTKLVSGDEIGKVSAVLGALEGMMPILISALYSAVYHASVSTFPAAHFFLGPSASFLMMTLFCVVIVSVKTKEYDVEGAKPPREKGPIFDQSFVKINSSLNWLTGNSLALTAVSCPEAFVVFTDISSRDAEHELSQVEAKELRNKVQEASAAATSHESTEGRRQHQGVCSLMACQKDDLKKLNTTHFRIRSQKFETPFQEQRAKNPFDCSSGNKTLQGMEAIENCREEKSVSQNLRHFHGGNDQRCSRIDEEKEEISCHHILENDSSPDSLHNPEISSHERCQKDGSDSHGNDCHPQEHDSDKQGHINMSFEGDLK